MNPSTGREIQFLTHVGEEETHSGVQSAALLPLFLQSAMMVWTQVNPSGADVVAAPPRAMPLARRGTMSFIQYETESEAAMLH